MNRFFLPCVGREGYYTLHLLLYSYEHAMQSAESPRLRRCVVDWHQQVPWECDVYLQLWGVISEGRKVFVYRGDDSIWRWLVRSSRAANSAFDLIDGSSVIRLLAILINLNCKIPQKDWKEVFHVHRTWINLKEEAYTRPLSARTHLVLTKTTQPPRKFTSPNFLQSFEPPT